MPRTGRNREANALDPTRSVVTLRLVDDTRAQYNFYIQRMKRFLLASFPQFVVNSEIHLPLTLEVCEAYLNYASVKRDKDGNDINPRMYNTYSTINACKSAIKYLYKEADKIPSSDLNILLKDFFSGYKRKIELLKEGGQMPIGEGKSPMSPAGFLFLSEKALTAKSDFALSTTAHVSLVMCWNLIARAASVASIRFDNMSWEGDALLVQYGRTKNDQEGTSCSPKHVYANPSCPWICHILSLSLLVFTRGMPTSGSTTLLLASNSQERFSEWLAKISAGYGDDIASMGPTATPCPTQTSTVTPHNQGLSSAKVRCPTSKTYDLWTMWWSGRSLDKAIPLRKLRRRDYKQTSEKVNFSKASTVMRELLSCTNLNEPDIVKMSQLARDLLFQSCFNQLCGKVFQSCNDSQVVQRRVDEMSYHTIYDLLKKASQ
ncbi:hypothetical protein Ae201684P_004994 [Aphanomyces euteiches]|uniref:Core-binding (CB) domain-containing protein n=1 Tax=Aphanomyces euteiches TaxID=100861 RepID=A0A6G0W901_9STRA|nr:hypothetical protein Ae201684_017448 [Aphanomyces euteiches]KAH9085284.1 hypothetical protein Ae201684P_004994 [Aphanomyces euteiches]